MNDAPLGWRGDRAGVPGKDSNSDRSTQSATTTPPLPKHGASQAVRWFDFHLWVQERLDAVGEYPMAGTQAWFDLDDCDRRKWASVLMPPRTTFCVSKRHRKRWLRRRRPYLVPRTGDRSPRTSRILRSSAASIRGR